MVSRRSFIREAFLGAASLTVGSAVKSFAFDPTGRGVSGANERIRIAIIGVNSRGRGIASGLSKINDCEITWICDVDSRAIARCQEVVNKNTGKTPKGEKDLRKVLEAPDVDAVVIAMPDHWHAPAAIMAMQAGKHVYLEKPTSHNPAENDMLMRAALKYKSVVQVGNQRRSWPNVIAGIEEIKAGTIGNVRYARSWYTNSRKSIGQGKPAPVPEWLDWDLWQGPAPRVEYRDNIVHYNWHWFKHWGTGEALNNGTHFVDILRWGLDVQYPTRVDSVGGRYNYADDDWEFPDTQLISFQFGDKASGSWEGRSCNPGTMHGYGLGVVFHGDKANLYFSGSNEYRIKDFKGNVIKEVNSKFAFEEGNLINPSEALDILHFRNWFDAIRKGTPLNSSLVEACISTQLVQYGNIAQEVGHSLEIDPLTGRILNSDKEINRLWGRKYEKGWEPKI